MKNIYLIAPLSLVIAILLFIATLPFADIFIFGLLHAFAEASMIGGLADWFAVVALFRHPFGVPIPHTAIIPKYRAKLTTGIIDIVQNTWLNKETIQARIKDVHIVSSVLKSLEDPAHREAVFVLIRNILREVFREIEPHEVAKRIAIVMKSQVKEEDLIRWLRLAGERGMAQGWHEALLRHALSNTVQWLSSDRVRALIARNLKKIAEDYSSSTGRRIMIWLGEQTNLLNYDDLSVVIVQTLRDDLSEILSDSDHPARKDFEEWLRKFFDNMEENIEFRRFLEHRLHEFFEAEQTAAGIALLLARLREWILADLERADSATMQHIDSFISHSLERFRKSETTREAVEDWIKERIVHLVEEYHGEIGEVVRHNLEKLDDKQLVDQIENKVGGDLQWIRLNGAIVGGMVGAVIFLLKHFL